MIRMMSTCLTVLICATLASCGIGGTETGSGHENPMAQQGLCTGLPVIDGRFTFWPDCHEYAERTPGIFGDLNVRVGPKDIYVLNDWHHRADEDIPDYYYNRFTIDTATDRWEVRVYGDDVMTVLRNGATFAGDMAGASGFLASPYYDFPHTIYEFRLPVGSPTSGCSGVVQPGFSIMEADPGPQVVLPNPDEPEATMVDEPTIFCAVLDPATGEVTVTGTSEGPVITRGTVVGGTVNLYGARFGSDPATVVVNGTPVTVSSGSEEALTASLPPGAAGTIVARVTTPEGTSAPFAITMPTVTPPPDASADTWEPAEDTMEPDVATMCPPNAPEWEDLCCTCAPENQCSAGVDNALGSLASMVNPALAEAIADGELNYLVLVRESDVVILPATPEGDAWSPLNVGFDADTCAPQFLLPAATALPILITEQGPFPLTWPGSSAWATAQRARLTLTSPDLTGLISGAIRKEQLETLAAEDPLAEVALKGITPDISAAGGKLDAVSFGIRYAAAPASLAEPAGPCELPAGVQQAYRITSFQLSATGHPGDGHDVDTSCTP